MTSALDPRIVVVVGVERAGPVPHDIQATMGRKKLREFIVDALELPVEKTWPTIHLTPHEQTAAYQSTSRCIYRFDESFH